MENNFHTGEVKAFNADKEIALQRDLPLVINLMKAFRQARTGETPIKSLYEMDDNERTFNKVKGLGLVCVSIRDLILLGWGRVESSSRNIWNAKKPEERGEFEKEQNDFNSLMYYKELIKACEMDLREASRTKTTRDDFMVKKINNDGDEELDLTDNYFEMLEILENTWSKVEMILHKHKILSQGMVEDEMLSHEQIAEEAYNRVVDS